MGKRKPRTAGYEVVEERPAVPESFVAFVPDELIDGAYGHVPQACFNFRRFWKSLRELAMMNEL